MEKENPYDSVAEWYEKNFGGRENRYLGKFAGLLPRKARVLDAGCGVGDDTKFLLEKGFKVVSIVSSKSMLTIAREKLPRHEFLLMDMRKLDYPAESFDGVVSAFTLHHVGKKEALGLVRKLRRMLKTDGIIYLALQEGKGKIKRTVNWNPKHENIFWVNMYTLQEIKRLLNSVGLTIIFKTKANPISKKAMQNKKLYVIARKVK